MVPSSPYDTGSQAEKRIFERLGFALDDRYVALHSFKPTKHPRKRFTEIDFVICGPEGIYVLEVKGGKVSYTNGVWQFQNRHGRVTSSHEGPFRQAENALHGLVECLKTGLPDEMLNRLTIGYGVLFPDCEWRAGSAEWDSAMVGGARRSRDLEGWLRNLFSYWNKRSGRRVGPSKSEIEEIQEYLRPEAEGRDSINEDRFFEHVVDVQGLLEPLAEYPMRVAGMDEARTQVLCARGSGGGTTLFAQRLAKHWTEAGLQVALVCRLPWLRHFLDSRLLLPGLTVSLIEGVHLDCRRAGLRRFDAIIVVEGEDLFDMPCIDALDAVLAGGLESGRWCWFFDPELQSLTRQVEPRAWEFLEALEPLCFRINYRNPRVVLERVPGRLGKHVRLKIAEGGPDLREHSVGTIHESALRIASEISELVDVRGLSPGSVTVLSPFDFAKSSVSQISPEMSERLCRLDEYSMRDMPVDKVGFASIKDFKGLENEAIVVADLPRPDGREGISVDLYMAMNSARSMLSLIHLDRA